MKTENHQRIFLIINPFSGFSRKNRMVKKVISFLMHNGCDVDYALTKYPGHATELAIKASADGFDLVVAAGGDGTVNEVARGLLGTSATMGIVPCGSGNGLARELKIPFRIRKCGQTLINGRDIKVDVGWLNNQPFLCTCGAGFNSLVADEMSKAAFRGFFKYAQIVVRESINYKPVRIRLRINGVMTEKQVFMITFANVSQFGNNAYIAPGASPADGLIDVVIIKPFLKIISPLVVLAVFFKFIRKLWFVEYFRTDEIYMETDGDQKFYFDGEPVFSARKALITVEREKLTVRGNFIS